MCLGLGQMDQGVSKRQSFNPQQAVFNIVVYLGSKGTIKVKAFCKQFTVGGGTSTCAPGPEAGIVERAGFNFS